MYIKCPENKILVVFGKVSENDKSAYWKHEGITFVLPFFQDYTFLDLSGIELKINNKLLIKISSHENIN